MGLKDLELHFLWRVGPGNVEVEERRFYRYLDLELELGHRLIPLKDITSNENGMKVGALMQYSIEVNFFVDLRYATCQCSR
jgi:hypothetical protein